MSKIALSGNNLGTGTFTIAAPNSNNSRTMLLPDSAGDVVVTQATQTLTNKTFSGAQVFGTASLAEPTGTAPLYMCRAWVNFNGTGTVAIRASGNVSSITDNGTGDYTVNFTTAMPDANYAVNSTIRGVLNGAGIAAVNATVAPTTSAVRVISFATSGALGDTPEFYAAIFR
jgi:hypothetical protein